VTAAVSKQNKEMRPLNGKSVDPNIYKGISDTLAKLRTKIFNSINFDMVEAYWEIGRQI
jgi:hypothetical protein